MSQILIILLAFFHPFYVSVTEIKHNVRTKSLEISSRVFYDDLEVALENSSKSKIDILNPFDRKKVDAAMADYFAKHLQLSVNRKVVNIKYLGYEIEDDAAWCYFEVPKVLNVGSITIKNDILYQEHSEQINMMHVIVKGKRQSTKLDNPKANAEFSF